MNMIFGKYVNNNSFLTKTDARIKILATLFLMILSFFNLNIFVYIGFFSLVLLVYVLSKLSLKPIGAFFKNTWIIIAIVFLLNLLFGLKEDHFLINSVIDTTYIVLRILVLLLISSLLTSTTNPSELTYGLEWYLTPLKAFKVDVHDVAIMMTIAIRFVPTLLEEADKIMKAQSSRGVDFTQGNIISRMSATISIIIPLFMLCFEKSEDLAEAMTVKGYGMGPRSKYKRKRYILNDVISSVILISVVVLIFVVNGVI